MKKRDLIEFDCENPEMLSSRAQIDQLVCTISQMGRKKVKSELLNFRGRFKLDFTDDYLESLSLERLRHILLAAKVQHLRNH